MWSSNCFKRECGTIPTLRLECGTIPTLKVEYRTVSALKLDVLQDLL